MDSSSEKNNVLATSWGKEFISGGVGGSVGVLAGHPLDTVRIRQQHGSNSQSAFAIFRQVISREGPGGLYRGLLAPLASITFQNAVTFQSYGTLSRAINGAVPTEPLPYTIVGLAGFGAGIVQSPIISPIELVKIRLQLQSNSKNGGPIQMARTIIQTSGYHGLFRGLGITILRDAPSHGMYFWTYECVREWLHPRCRKEGGESCWTMLVAGGMAGMSSWVVSYPSDVVKTRMQSGVSGGMMQCLKRIVEKEGWHVVWKGLGTTLTRAFVVNAAVFTAYESTMRCMDTF